MLKDRLKLERNNKKMSQRDLAGNIGVSQQAVGSWETGRTDPDQEMLRTLAIFFNVSVDYLLGTTELRNYSNHTQEDISDHDKFMKNLEVQFMDASERDRDKIYRDISELYWKYKDEE